MANLISEELKRELFDKIQPSLIAIGYKFKDSDPKGSALSWWSRYHEIIEMYNSSPDMHKIRLKDGTEHRISEIDESNKADWMRSMSAYLSTAYKNNYIAAIAKNKISTKNDKDWYAPLSSTASTHVSAEEQILLSDLIAIIAKDAARKASLATTYTEIISALILEGLLTYYKGMVQKYGNVNIVRDYHASTPRYFFISDISESRAQEVGAYIAPKAAEYGKVVEAKIKSLCSESSLENIKRRIDYYLLDFNGGIIQRLKKRKTNEFI